MGGETFLWICVLFRQLRNVVLFREAVTEREKQLSVVPSFRFCGNGSVEIGAVFREIKKQFLPRGIYFAMGKAENIFGGIPGALPKEIVKPTDHFKSHKTSLI